MTNDVTQNMETDYTFMEALPLAKIWESQTNCGIISNETLYTANNAFTDFPEGA